MVCALVAANAPNFVWIKLITSHFAQRQYMRHVAMSATNNDDSDVGKGLDKPPSRLRQRAARGDRSLARLDVRSVGNDPGRVTDYALKTVRSGRLSYDDAVLVLPRCVDELPARS